MSILTNGPAIAAEDLKVVPLRHPWRWATAGLVLTGLVFLVRAVVVNPHFQWEVVGRYLFHPSILSGIATTVTLTAVIMVLAVTGGTVLALMMLSPSLLLRVPALGFVWIFRGIPALVQLILWYNLSLVFPTVGLDLPFVGTVFSVRTNDLMTPFASAVIAFSLVQAAYTAEIVRAGLGAVDRGQAEAAASLGIKPSLIIRRIVLPQAMRIVIPPTGNEAINLLKATSLVSVIAVGDVLYSAQAIYARTFETIPLLLVATFWYLFVVSVLSWGQFHLERHFGRNQLRLSPSRRFFVRFNWIPFRRRDSI